MHNAIKTIESKISEIEQVRCYAEGEEKTALSVILYQHQTVLRLIDRFLNNQKITSYEYTYVQSSHRKMKRRIYQSKSEKYLIYRSVKDGKKTYKEIGNNIGMNHKVLKDKIRRAKKEFNWD